MSSERLSEPCRARLFEIARESIRRGLADGRASVVDAAELPAELAAHGAAFVSVYVEGALRGCTGELSARRALGASVAENAFLAAFKDNRFPAIRTDELDSMRLQISVLTPPTPIDMASESELLQVMQPGVDGITIAAHGRRATFLPQVWKQLPEPELFLRQLKRKAGLPSEPIPELEAWRYRAEVYEESPRS